MTKTDDIKRAAAHTPEPWAEEYLPYLSSRSTGTEAEIPCYRINPIDAPEEYICETNEHLDGRVQEANARRIVAAVNACAGIISTEALELGVVRELLEALEAQEMAEWDAEASRRKGYFDRARKLRRAAIAKATGRAA